MRTKPRHLRAGFLLAIIAALALSACGDDSSDDSSTKTFQNDAYPFTFEYPGSLTETTDVSIDKNLGGDSTQDNVGLAIDDSNLILLQRATLNFPVDASNLDPVKQQVDDLVGQVDKGASGQTGETGGFPSITYTQVPAPSVQDGESEITFMFDGSNEYVMNCQSTPDQRDALSAACDQALSTLKKN